MATRAPPTLREGLGTLLVQRKDHAGTAPEALDFDLLSVLIDQPLVGLYLIQNETFCWVNETWAANFGYRADEVIGRPITLTTTPADVSRAASARASARWAGVSGQVISRGIGVQGCRQRRWDRSGGGWPGCRHCPCQGIGTDAALHHASGVTLHPGRPRRPPAPPGAAHLVPGRPSCGQPAGHGPRHPRCARTLPRLPPCCR